MGIPLNSGLQNCLEESDEAGTTTLEHECGRLLRCLSVVGTLDLGDPAVWDLRLAREELAAGDQATAALGSKRPYVAINLGGKVPNKDWGLLNWEHLMLWLNREYPQLDVLAVGAAEDAGRVEQLSKQFHGKMVNCCGTLSPRESAAAMRNARLFVGHDSGPLHLAAAVGLPCVGLFGDYNKPKHWHPPGQRHRIIHNLTGIQMIQIADVANAIKDILPTENRVSPGRERLASKLRGWMSAPRESAVT